MIALVVSLTIPIVYGEDVSLAWDASVSENVSGYNVYIGNGSRTYQSQLSAGNQTSCSVSGLTSGTWYLAVTAYDIDGNESDFSNEVSHTISEIDATPPSISATSSSNITSNSAIISWITNELSDSQIDYGTTASYGNITISSTLSTSHVFSLSVLASSTLYHYRVRSKDAAGNLSVSGDLTFTTTAPPDTTAPVISGVAASSITSTGVSIAWITNEVSNTQIEYGTSTSYGTTTALAAAMITSHAQTLNGLTPSTLYHYRVRSKDAAGNLSVSGDLTFTTKAPPDITAPVISGVAASSITSTGVSIAWITNEVSNTQIEYGTSTSYGTTTVLAAAMITSHAQTLNGLAASTLYHYRVRSKDAAGNLGVSGDLTFTTTAPPDTTAPVISGVAASSITSTGVSIAWITNEVSNTQIEYGTSTSYGTTTVLAAAMITSHAQTLNGLAASTLYHYRVRSKDAAGNLGVSGDLTFTTKAPPDTTAPVISGVASSGITSTGVSIAWNTNEVSNTQIEYGTSTSYGTTTVLAAAMITSHAQTLNGLAASTLYHYRVRSKDAAGNLGVSGDLTFTTTAPPDTTAPVISGVASSGITSTGVSIAWITNEASSTQIEYGTSTSYGTTTALAAAMITSHAQTLNGLAASTLYHYRVRSKDAAGNLGVSGDLTFTTTAPPDTTAPVISGVASSGITSTGVSIAWITNEASSTQIEYGTSTSYGTTTALAAAMITSHAQTLNGLAASTLYHYRVRSKDAAGNLGVSGDLTFTTTAPPDTTAPVISGVAASSITSTGVSIAWNTNEVSNTQIEYGTSTSYGTTTALAAAMITSHAQTLNGLAASTLYHYRVRSKDAAGNFGVSGDLTFTTKAPPDTTAPVISGVASSGITSTGVSIAWITNEASSTQIEYGTSTSYGTSTGYGTITINAGNTTVTVLAMSKSHLQALNGLTAGTLYHYRVRSKDAAGNLAVSGDFTFTTAQVF